jgi:hypothetical protein
VWCYLNGENPFYYFSSMFDDNSSCTSCDNGKTLNTEFNENDKYGGTFKDSNNSTTSPDNNIFNQGNPAPPKSVVMGSTGKDSTEKNQAEKTARLDIDYTVPYELPNSYGRSSFFNPSRDRNRSGSGWGGWTN